MLNIIVNYYREIREAIPLKKVNILFFIYCVKLIVIVLKITTANSQTSIFIFCAA